MDDPYAELARVKARIAEMERMASQPPLVGLTGALEAIAAKPADPSRERARLESIARQFVPDPQSEDALRQRAAMGPAAYETQLRAMGADPLALSLYSRQRDAAIATGAWTPPTTEGASK